MCIRGRPLPISLCRLCCLSTRLTGAHYYGKRLLNISLEIQQLRFCGQAHFLRCLNVYFVFYLFYIRQFNIDSGQTVAQQSISQM